MFETRTRAGLCVVLSDCWLIVLHFVLVLVPLLLLEDAFDLLQSDCIFGQRLSSEERFDVITEDEDDEGNDAQDAADEDEENHENHDQNPPLFGLDQLATVAHSINALIILRDVKIGIDRCGLFLIVAESEGLEWAGCKDGGPSECIDMQSVEFIGGSGDSRGEMHLAVGPSVGDRAIEHHCAQKARLFLIAGIAKRARMDSSVKISDLSADSGRARDSSEQIGARSVKIKDRHTCRGIRGLIIDTNSISESVEAHVARVGDVGSSR